MSFILPWSTPAYWTTYRAKLRSNLQQEIVPQMTAARSLSPSAPMKSGMSISPSHSFRSVLNQQLAQNFTAVQHGKRTAAGYDSPSPPIAQEAVGIRSNAEVLQTVGTWFEYVIQPGDTLWNLAVSKFHVNVQDLIKDNDILDPRRLQPGQKIRVRQASDSGDRAVVASWYGPGYHGKPMANGQPYDMYANTIAHKDLPLGTIVELQNPDTGQKVNAVVADRGPFIAGRDVDLSYGVAQKLSMVAKGVGNLVMRILG